MNNEIAQAGAIVMANGANTPKFLLILSRKKPIARIFPKGHIEPGESAFAAAERELVEEAGVTGELVSEVGTITYEFSEKRYRVTFFLFRFVEVVSRGEDGRDPEWFSPEEAADLLPFEGLKSMLRTALDL